MTKIQEMVEYIEKYGQENSHDCPDNLTNMLTKARRLADEEKSKPAPVEAKATAEASLVEYPCPTCGAERFKTERRMNGDSWCRYGHKHPTKDFYRPASPAVEELVKAKENIEKAMKGITERQTQEDSYWRGYYNCLEETWDSLNVQIAKYDNAKGGK